MELLPDELKARLPPLFSQEAVDEPHVYAKLFLPGTALAWYVLEGEAAADSDFVLACFFGGPEQISFAHFQESFLRAVRGPNAEILERDLGFTEGKLTDVVPAPDF